MPRKPNNTHRKQPFSLLIHPVLLEAARALAHETGNSLNEVFHMCILQGLELEEKDLNSPVEDPLAFKRYQQQQGVENFIKQKNSNVIPMQQQTDVEDEEYNDNSPPEQLDEQGRPYIKGMPFEEYRAMIQQRIKDGLPSLE